MQYESFDELINKRLRSDVRKKRLAVVSAAEEHTLITAVRAYREGLAEPILIGDKSEILEILDKIGCDETLDIIQADTPEQSVEIFTSLAKKRECQAVMKGMLDSKILLKALVSKENQLKGEGILSSISIYQIPSYHKLLCITDAGVNMYPDYKQKKEILRNAINAFRTLGYERPKAAVLCAVEKVNPKMPETLDAERLQKDAEAGVFGNVSVCGPISFDLCVDRESSETKGFHHPVAGDADIIMVNNICTGNAVSKAISLLAGGTACSLLVGASIPVVFTSRASSLETKYNSLIAALAMY